MTSEPADASGKKLPIVIILVIIVILAFIFMVSWLLTRGVEDDAANVPAINSPSTEQLPQNSTEPTNPNVTGGSSGAGNSTSNDPTLQTPSPAGGVDTNQMPAGSPTSQ